MCEWYARCGNAAVGTTPHPILGDVPICQRCADKHDLPVKKAKCEHPNAPEGSFELPLVRCPDCQAILLIVPTPLTCYACHAAVGATELRCHHCGNTVRCEEPGCDADMESYKCPNDKSSCLDHCGEDHD